MESRTRILKWNPKSRIWNIDIVRLKATWCRQETYSCQGSFNKGWVTVSTQKIANPDWIVIYPMKGEYLLNNWAKCPFLYLQFVVEAESKEKRNSCFPSFFTGHCRSELFLLVILNINNPVSVFWILGFQITYCRFQIPDSRFRIPNPTFLIPHARLKGCHKYGKETYPGFLY